MTLGAGGGRRGRRAVRPADSLNIRREFVARLKPLELGAVDTARAAARLKCLIHGQIQSEQKSTTFSSRWEEEQPL